jgi:hypothetical protein
MAYPTVAPAIGRPFLGHLEYCEGQEACLLVPLRRREPAPIEVTFEVLGGSGAFRPIGEVTARVEDRVALARLPLRDLELRDRQLRCTVWCAGEQRVCDPALVRPAPRLHDPRWLGTTLRDGAQARLQIGAHGLEGRKVRFVVEHRVGAEWRPFAQLTSRVERGLAQAGLEVRYPREQMLQRRDPGETPLRFFAELAA